MAPEEETTKARRVARRGSVRLAPGTEGKYVAFARKDAELVDVSPGRVKR